MGKSDITTKAYMSKNEIFADAFNFLIYDGKQVIKADELEELDSTEIVLPYGNRASEPKQKFRDVLKIWTAKRDKKAVYVVLGIENQSEIQYAMAVKNMLYDSMNYASQVEKAARSYRKSKNNLRLSSAEFLSGFRKEDKLIPVITLTVYFGAEKWDGAKSIHEMLSVQDEELLKFVPDYKLNLITPASIKEEDFEKFKTGLGMAMQYIKHQKDEDLASIAKNKRFEQVDRDTANLINTFSKSKLKFEENRGDVNMCYALENSLRKAKQEGKIEGEIEGKIEGENNLLKLIKFLIRDNKQQEIERITNDEQKRQELYKFYGIVTE